MSNKVTYVTKDTIDWNKYLSNDIVYQVWGSSGVFMNIDKDVNLNGVCLPEVVRWYGFVDIDLYFCGVCDHQIARDMLDQYTREAFVCHNCLYQA